MVVRRRGDGGSSYAQWLALGVLAAVIIAGLVPVAGTAIGSGASRVICTIVHAGSAATCAPVTGGGDDGTIDTNPQWCVSSMSADGWENTLSYWFVSAGSGAKVLRYDSREEDFDGKVKHYVYLAFVNKGDAGINVSKAGQKIDIGGGIYLSYGDMYRLTPEQYKKFHRSIELWQDYLDRFAHPWGTAGGGISDNTAYNMAKRQAESEGVDFPPKAPGPAITFGEHTEQGQPTVNAPINGDKKLKAPQKYVVPNGATFSTTQAHTVTTEHWYIYKDPGGKVLPATATYHTYSGTYTAGAGRTGTKTTKGGRSGNAKAEASYSLDYTSTTRITRDDRTGKLRNIRYVVTYGDRGTLVRGAGVSGKDRGAGKKSGGVGTGDSHSDGKLHTEVIQINFALDDDKNQKIGEDWLKRHGTEVPPEVANEVFPKSGVIPDIPDDKPDAAAPPAGADPFDRLIYDKAMAWKTDAQTKDEALQFNATLPFARGIGVKTEFTGSQTKTTKAQILDAPGSDGKRHWIDYPDCTAAGNH